VIPFPGPVRPRWIHRARRVYRFFAHPWLSTGYTVFHALFAGAWLLLLGSISFLAMVLR
jgi:hypothetical protein